jgi:Polyketide cyclase / dehydrase and lipid transport
VSAIHFEHALEIAVPRARLHAFLAALENFAPLHPLIESITSLPPDPARPAARHYRVVDRIPVGPFRLEAIYRAAIEVIAEDEIRGEAWQSPGVHLVTTYHLEPRGTGTRLRESVVVEAPFGLRRFVAHQASTSHRATLEGIKALLERETRT